MAFVPISTCSSLSYYWSKFCS